MATSLATLATEFRSLAGDLLLPPLQGRSPSLRSLLRLGALLLASAALALGAAVVLLGTSAQLIAWLIGPGRLDLAFPYLGRALRTYTAERQGVIALAVALCGLVPWWLLQRGLVAGLRRRWLLLTLLLALLVLSTAVDVAFTEGNGAVMEALNVRSAQRFWGTAAGLTAIYLLSLPVQFLTTYGQGRFALVWRDRTSRTLWEAYLAGQAYYRLESAGAIDNPDQRIAEDIDRSVVRSTSLFFGFFASLLSLTAYVLVLFSISGALVLTLLITTLAGNAAILQLVRRLATLSFRQQTLEADFRFALMHLRSHAESVAFLRGEARERSSLEQRFARLLLNLERVIRWRTVVGQSSGLYGFLMQFVPYLVLSGAYFGGRVTLGQLTVGSIAFSQVQVALSFLVEKADDFSGLFASLHRIGELRAATDSSLNLRLDPTQRAGLRHDGPELVLERLCVADPGGDGLLIRDLDLRLAVGERLLITGPSGCGKTTLLRVLCGLVPAASGRLLTPAPGDWMVLPQKAYLALGSLRDQLLYTRPPQASPVPEGELRRVLTLALLETLLVRYPDLGVEADWDQVLSGGEQQRLGFARLLLDPCPFVVLDEATSALDLETERHLYGLLLKAGLAVISVGHRPSLEVFHQRILRLDGHGIWSLQEV
jgi:putative ATP-binding cassette transporter